MFLAAAMNCLYTCSYDFLQSLNRAGFVTVSWGLKPVMLFSVPHEITVYYIRCRLSWHHWWSIWGPWVCWAPAVWSRPWSWRPLPPLTSQWAARRHGPTGGGWWRRGDVGKLCLPCVIWGHSVKEPSAVPTGLSLASCQCSVSTVLSLVIAGADCRLQKCVWSIYDKSSWQDLH